MKNHPILRNIIIILTALTAVFALSSSIMHENVGFFLKFTGDESEEAEYCDMLIRLDEGDEWYTEFNTAAELPFGAESELVRYSDDGYRSVTLHFRDASNRDGKYVTIPEKWENDHGGNNKAFKAFCQIFKTAKIAVTDKQGNIVSVSEEFALISGGVLPIVNSVGYDLSSGEMKLSYDANAMNGVFTASLLWVWASVAVLALYFLISSAIARKHGKNHLLNIIVSLLLNLPFVNLCTALVLTAFARMSSDGANPAKLILYVIAGVFVMLIVTGEFINIAITAYFINQRRSDKNPQLPRSDKISG